MLSRASMIPLGSIFSRQWWSCRFLLYPMSAGLPLTHLSVDLRSYDQSLGESELNHWIAMTCWTKPTVTSSSKPVLFLVECIHFHMWWHGAPTEFKGVGLGVIEVQLCRGLEISYSMALSPPSPLHTPQLSTPNWHSQGPTCPNRSMCKLGNHPPSPEHHITMFCWKTAMIEIW